MGNPAAREPRVAGLDRRSRSLGAWLVVLVGLPAVTLALLPWRGSLSLASTLLLYLLVVVLAATLGGVVPGLVAALTADLLANYFFTPPYGTFHIESRDNLVAVLVFVAVAIVVSVLVESSSRRREEAARSLALADLLSQVTEAPVGEVQIEAVLEEIRSTFDRDEVRLQTRNESGTWTDVAGAGHRSAGADLVEVPAGTGLRLVLCGEEQFAVDRRTLTQMALAAGRVHQERQLRGRAEESSRLAELDRTRSALLAAVGHDLRTPLAGVKAAVTSLRQADVDWTDDERRELLATIDESADRLDALVANLLDATRIQAGSVVVDAHPVQLDEVVFSALPTASAEQVRIQVPESLPLVLTDPVLLERVVVNLVENAQRFQPPGSPVEVRAEEDGSGVRLQVVDRGRGLSDDERAHMFEPFRRFDDRTHAGSGLGLTIVRGFCDAMGVGVEPLTTPGGGLTMELHIPVAP